MKPSDIDKRLKSIRKDVASRSRMRDNNFSRSETPEPNFDSNTLKKYHNELSEEKSRLEKRYSQFYNDPEKHSNYREKWASFWSFRSKELVKIKCNPKNYDFTNEWKDYFFEYLKDLKTNEYKDLKKSVYEKYQKLNKKKRERSREKSYSRSPTRSSRNRSADRSHSSRYSRSNSSAHEDFRKKRAKFDINWKKAVYKAETVISVCRCLLSLDSSISLRRAVIKRLLWSAMDYEKKHNKKEYLMTQKEYEFLYRTKEFIIKSMNFQCLGGLISKMADAANKLDVLINRWERYMKLNGKLKMAIELRKESEKRALLFHERNRRNGNNGFKRIYRRSSSESSDFRSLQPSATSSRNNSLNMTTPLDFASAMINIKKEKTDAELEILKTEKAQILKQIKEEEILPEEKMSLQENAGNESNNNNEFQDIGDTKLSETDISDEELLELFKDFETSEDELDFVRQIMEEIEVTDPARFRRLKDTMESIQSSYENGLITSNNN